MSSCTWGAVAFPNESWRVLLCKAVVLIKLVTLSSPIPPDWKHCWLATYLLIKWENKRKGAREVSVIKLLVLCSAHTPFIQYWKQKTLPSVLQRNIHMARRELKGDFLYIFSNPNKEMYGMSSDYFRKPNMRVNIQPISVQPSYR